MKPNGIALEFLSGRKKGSVFVIEESTLIGSGSICEIQLEDSSISPMHARIAPKPNGQFAITDLTKAPDVSVNSVVIKSRVIKLGDEISIAGIKMRVIDPASKPAAIVTAPHPTTQPTDLPAQPPEQIATAEAIVPPADTITISNPGATQTNPTDAEVAISNKPDAAKTQVLPDEPIATQPEEPTHPAAMPSMASTGAAPIAAPTDTTTTAPPATASTAEVPKPKTTHPHLKVHKHTNTQQMRMTHAHAPAPKAPPKPHRKGVPLWVRLSIAAGIAVIMTSAITAAFFNHQKNERLRFVHEFEQLKDNTTRDSDETLLRKLNSFKARVPVKNHPLHREINAALTETQSRIEQEVAFREILAFLDTREATFTASGDLESAIAVYQTAPEHARKRVLEMRAQRIEDLTKQMQSVQQQTDATDLAERLLEEQKAGQIAFNTLIENVMERILARENPIAVIDEALRQSPELRHHADDVVTIRGTATELVNVANALQPGVKETDAAMHADNPISPIVRALLLLRNQESWEARNFLQQNTTHPLAGAITEQLGRFSSDLTDEQKAMRAFLDAWKDVDPSAVRLRRIPSAPECITQLEQAIQSSATNRSRMAQTLQAILKVSQDFTNSAFARRYATLFDMAYRQLPALLHAADSAVGNGRILQVEGNRIFVESNIDLEGLQDAHVGIIVNPLAFFSPQGARLPVAMRYEIAARFPFVVLANRQLVFVAPEMNRLDLRPGQPVEIARGLAVGPKITPIEQQSNVFTDNFSAESVAQHWRAERGTFGIDGQRLFFAAPPPRGAGRSATPPKRGAADDLHLRTQAPFDSIEIGFTLHRNAQHALAIMLAPVSIVFGGDEATPEGIYYRGNLIHQGNLLRGQPDAPSQISISIHEGHVTASANQNTVSGRIPSDASYSNPTNTPIRFFSGGRNQLERFTLGRPNRYATPQLLGLAANGRTALVARPTATPARSMRNTPIFFYHQDHATTPLTDGLFTLENETLLVADLSEPLGRNAVSARVSLLPLQQATASGALSGLQDPDIATWHPLAQRDTVILAPITTEGSSTLRTEFPATADMPVRIPEAMLPIYTIDHILAHPVSGEQMAATSVTPLGVAIARQNGRSATLRFNNPLPENTKLTERLLLSATTTRLDPLQAADQTGGALITSPPGGYGPTGDSFWHFDRSNWHIRDGRLISVPRAGNPPPVITASRTFPANAQYDITLQIQHPAEKGLTNWDLDMLFELYFPASQRGITFGLSTEQTESLWIGGRTVTVMNNRKPPYREHRLPERAAVTNDTRFARNPPKLDNAQDYSFRIRRIQNQAALYVNGKRLAHVMLPDAEGDVQLRIAAPAQVSIGRAVARDLPFSVKAIRNEAELGDFGYVLAAPAGNTVLIDSDTPRIRMGNPVSFMEIDNRIVGSDSQTIVLRTVARGTVTAIGPRTSVVTLAAPSHLIKPGTKVFMANMPETFMLSDERLRDLAAGL
jgi:hypothetical protein